jgi:trehalose synthase
MSLMDAYIPIVGESVVEDLRLIASHLSGKRIRNINSTAVGGGVAEILTRMIPMLRDMGVDALWDVIRGGEQYFEVTKKFHNALHGGRVEIDKQDFEIFLETSRKNIDSMDTSGDIIFVHDPQPIALIGKKTHNQWIWRCHIDLSKPDKRVWRFLREFVVQYDAAVFSAAPFSCRLPIRQFLIAPSIDPLSDKNRDLPVEYIDQVLKKYGIPTDKPIVTQISRFDRLKDPLGVIAAYRMVKRYLDCRLILAGGTAVDDPEGQRVYMEVREAAEGDEDIHILAMSQNDLEINALQRASAVIVQKSLKEGFGLTVSEALWKSKPVVASSVGGIPQQITHKYSGLLCYSAEGAAFAIKQLLANPDYARKIGDNGHQHIKNNFLITRHLRDYLLLFLSLYHRENVVYL